MSQWLLRGCALAGLFVCTFPVAAMAGEKLAAAPYAVIGAGSDLVAISADQQLWRRDNRDGADWLAVAPLPGETGFKITDLTCAADHSGVCIVTVGDGRISHLDLFQAGKGMVRTLTLNDADIEAMPDKNSAFIGRARRDGGRDIYRHNLSDGSDVRIGTVQADESAVYVMVDGKLTPVARKGFDFREVSDLANPPGFHLPDFENLIWTPEGALVREPWAHNPPIQADVRGIADIRFVRGEKDGRASLQPNGSWFIAFPVSGPIPESYNGAADANNDVVLEMIGPEKDMLGVLCQSGHGPIVQYIADIQHDEMTHISASASATGFVLTTTSLSFTPLIQTLRLSPSPVPGGWRTRPCAATTATISNADVVSQIDDSITLTTGEAVSRDGTRLSYTLLTPKGVTPEHVIIDVYGAYGRRRDYSAYNAQTKQVLIDTKTAIAFPLIRGDGDKGFAWAMASATPHRQVAAEDVIAVAQSLRAHYPEVKRVTVRGQSAGGWLAVKAALQRPDLFAGAISYSGVYLMKDDPFALFNSQHFFDANLDDLAADVAALKGDCHGLRFRLLHAKDDETSHYDRAQSFAGQLTAQGCLVDMVSFDSGGHLITLYSGQTVDAERRLKGYFVPVIPVNH